MCSPPLVLTKWYSSSLRVEIERNTTAKEGKAENLREKERSLQHPHSSIHMNQRNVIAMWPVQPRVSVWNSSHFAQASAP
mmetsp:Transcript_3376/g.9299  ORF Transcript_3376/g.9299 Transcript_3376/m.9299 type:complete len:80 (+) Transcript_3376:1010-1249(+)